MIMLSVVLPTPLRANAVIDDTTKNLYVLGTVAAYGGIDVDVDNVANKFPNFVDDVIDLAKEIYADYAVTYGWTNNSNLSNDNSVIQAANDIQGYLDYLVSGLKPYNPVSLFLDYRFVFCVVRAIARWCEENLSSYTPPDPNAVYGGVYVPSGELDLYTTGSLHFDFPVFASDGSAVISFPVNNCTFTYYYHPSRSVYYSLQGEVNSDTSLTSSCLFVISPLNSDVYFIYLNAGGGSNLSGNSYYNRPFYARYTNDSYGFDFSMPSRSESTYTAFQTIRSSSNVGSGYFMIGGTKCKLSAYYNQSASFVDENGNVVRDLTFSDGLSALAWFFDLCCINIRPNTTTSYVPVDTSESPILIDNTTYEQTVTNITNTFTNSNYHEGDTVEMIFPSYYVTNNYYNYDDYRQHPEYIFDFNQDGLLDTNFNMPAYDGNKLANKFPFCIPFDIIHLFTNFSAEAEAPELHFVVLPENSFNLGNDEFSIDIDFQDYNIIVQILRFFIAVGFVLWLMIITNNVLQH